MPPVPPEKQNVKQVPTEQQLAARADCARTVSTRWRESLMQDGDLEDYSYFELGGTSVSAARLLVKLSHEFGYVIPLPALYENPSLRQFRNHLRAQLLPGLDAV